MKVNTLQGMLDQFFSNQGTDVEVLAEYYRNTFLEAYKSHELTAFYEESVKFSNQLEAMWEYFAIEENRTHHKIYFFAMIDTIRRLGEGMAKLDVNETKDYGNYKYIYPILDVLYRYGTVSVGNLAKYLNVERHTLTNAIRRASDFGLWRNKKQGRSSFYQITSKGEQAYVIYIKKKTVNNKSSLDELIAALLKEIALHMAEIQPDVNEIIRRLNRKLGCAGFGSSMMKIALQDIFKKRGEYIRTVNSLKQEYFKSASKLEWVGNEEWHIMNVEDVPEVQIKASKTRNEEKLRLRLKEARRFGAS